MKENFLRFFKSLQVKIFIIVFSAAVLPTVLFFVGYIHIFVQRSVEADREALVSEASLLSSQLATSGYLTDTDNDSIDVILGAVASSYSGRILIADSSLKVIKDTYGIDEGKIFIWKYATKALAGSDTYFYDKQNSIITICKPIVVKNSSDEEEVAGVLVISKSAMSINENFEYIRSLSTIFVIVVIIFAVVFGVWFGRRYSEPFKKLEVSLKSASSDPNSKKEPINSYSEAEELSSAIYDYVDKMQAIDASRQEFVSNVSHELKTPLTSMKVLADSLNSMGEAPVELYQEFMTDIGEEIERETQIINDLLSMVRMDKANATLNIESKNINELIDNLLRRLKPIAEAKKVELVFESYRPVVAEVDEVKLSLAISNLIENGIKYNKEGGFVNVSLNSDHRFFYIQVEDSGMGIPEESLDHVFERFYRVDKSHSREIGGTGLGLAITQMAVVMHDGEIKVASTVDEGTTFDVRIPLSHIKAEAEYES